MRTQIIRPLPDKESLSLMVVYKNPADYPGRFVVRRHLISRGITFVEIVPRAITVTLEEARQIIPPSAHNLHRHPDDDLCILEVWLM